MKLFIFGLLAISGAQMVVDRMKEQTARTIREKAFDIINHQVKYDENIVLSPLSILGCMYMLAAGSAGESRKQILETLNFGDAMESPSAVEKPFELYQEMIKGLERQPDKGYILNIANGIFHQHNMSSYSPNKLSAEYVDLLQKSFIKDVTNIIGVDFKNENVETTDKINKWVSEKTRGKIENLYEKAVPTDTLVVLASTLYFKASWNEKFYMIKKGSDYDKELCFVTSVEKLLGNICENVQWMRKTEDVHYHFYMDGNKKAAMVVDLPMKNKKFGDNEFDNKWMFQVWMPEDIITDEATDIDFRDLIKNNIGEVRKLMRKRNSNVVMPMFHIDYSADITETLKALGITDVFGNGANLSPMLGNENNAYVSEVNHAVNFNVDKNGVEGAAVTSARAASRSYSQPENLIFNKPFYFVVSNRCWYPEGNKGGSCEYGNVPLFIGRVVNPTDANDVPKKSKN